MITRESRTASRHVWSLIRSCNVLLLVFFSLLPTIHSQFFNLEAFRVRLPGRCQPGYFDCGRGQCVHLRCFHDGKPDCWDGSDEFCFPGHIKCGSYCVELSYLGQCLANNRCNGAANEPSFCRQTKEKICREELSLPCKGYGECVLWSWARDEKRDCLDGSDLDGSYMELLQSQWIHIMPTSAAAIGTTPEESPHPTTAFIPALGGSLLPSRNVSDPTPVLIVTQTPPVPPPTLIPTVPTFPPTYGPQPPAPSPYSVVPPYSPSPFQPQPAPIVPIVKIQSYPLTTPLLPTRPPTQGPIPASGLIPLTHPPPTPPHTTPRNPFGEAETASVPTTSEEQFFGSSETTHPAEEEEHPEVGVHPVDYPEDYGSKETDGTVVPHYGVPPTATAAPAAAPGWQPAAAIYPVLVGQTPSPAAAIQPVQPQRPIFRPVTAPYGQTAAMPGTTPQGVTHPPAPPPNYPYAPTMFPDRQPISAATPAPSYPQPSTYRPFTVIPFGVVPGQGLGPQPTIQNRPPWQQPSGPPLVAINPISPLGQQPSHPPPIAGQTPGPYRPGGFTPGPYVPGGYTQGPYRPGPYQPVGYTPGPYQPGGYRPSFGTPYPFTPGPGAVIPIVPSQPTWVPETAAPTVQPTQSSVQPTVTATTPPVPTASSTEQVFIPVGTETRTSTETTLTPTGSTITDSTMTTEKPVATSSTWIDEASHEAFRNDCEAGEIERVREKHGHDIDCPCGPGMMKRGVSEDEECEEVSTSAVVIDVVHLCDEDQVLNDEDRALVTLRELRRVFDYPMCVRDASVASGKILLDVVCGGSCTLDQMTYDYAKSPESRTGRTLQFEALSGGACSSTSLNDCEQPAECVVHGLQWRCRCPRGYNDTSEGRGRSCVWGEDSMEIKCIELLGICLIWWLALLLLALLLLCGICCLAWYLATRHCCKDRVAEAGYTQTRIKVPKNKVKPAEGDLSNVKNLMVKNAKGSALRGTVAMAQSKSLSTSSKRKSNLVLPGEQEAARVKSTIDIVSSDEENMGVPKPSIISIEGPAIPELKPVPVPTIPLPVQIDVTPATPHRTESIVSMREVAGTPPRSPTPPTAFAAAQAASMPILTAKPPTPPAAKKSISADAIETPIMEQRKTSVVTKPATPPRKESETGRKTPTPPVAIDSPQSISFAVPGLPSVDTHPEAHLQVAAVDVHQNNEPDERTSNGANRDRSASITSVAGLPTIWDSYQVLGEQYAHTEGSARRESSHSLDNALNRRYPEHFYAPLLRSPGAQEIETTSTESPPSTDEPKPSVESVLESFKESAFAPKNVVREVIERIETAAVPLPVEVFLDTDSVDTNPLYRKSSREETRKSSKSKLAEMLGVSESEPVVRKTSGFMDVHDSEALEELSRRGMQIEIPQLDTSQLDTASTTPRSTARGMRPSVPAMRGGRGAVRSEDSRSRERKGVHGLSKDRDRLVKATMETSTKAGRERSTETRSRSRERAPTTSGAAATKPPGKMTGAEERLYNFRRQQRDMEMTESSSSGYRQKPLRVSTDKSYRQSGREVFPGVHTATGLVSARSPEPPHPPAALARTSRTGGLTRRAVSRPDAKTASRSVEPPRQSTGKKPTTRPRGKSSPPGTATVQRPKPPPREETGLESAFFSRLAQPKIKKELREPKLEIKGKEQLRFRRPVRQLSSISEKSAEVPSGYAAGSDIAMSAPSTTRRVEAALGRAAKRLLLSPPSKRRSSPPSELVRSPMGTTIIEKKLILETIFSNEGTDVDMPLTSRHESVADLKGIVIVEKKAEYSSDSMDPVPRQLPSIHTHSHGKRTVTGRSDSFLPPISSEPVFRSPAKSLRASNTSLPSLGHRHKAREGHHSNDSSSATSSDFPTPPVASSLREIRRASQISTIRRKIRQRQTTDFRSQADLRSVGRERLADHTSRSADNLCDDCSSGSRLHAAMHARPRDSFLPTIAASSRSRSVANLPERTGRRSDRLTSRGAPRHSSLLSLRSGHTLSSAEMSPYLGRDPHLPPKENLWWGAHAK